MKVKDTDPKNTKNELGRSHNISEQNDASDLYDRGQHFVNQREAKLNNLRHQRDNSQSLVKDRSISTKRTPRIFDEIDTNERVENRLISYGKSKEMRLMEQRKLKELEEQNQKFSFAPQITKNSGSNPHSDLL